MYYVKVKQQNKLTVLVCALLCAAGVGLFGISFLPSLPFPFLAQGMGILALTFGVVLYTKFVLHTFYYSVSPGGVFDADGREVYNLEVIDEAGKKRTVVCRIGLRDITSVAARPARATKKNGQSEIRAEGGKVYRYCADLFPEQVLVIATSDGDTVVLTYDKGLQEVLRPER